MLDQVDVKLEKQGDTKKSFKRKFEEIEGNQKAMTDYMDLMRQQINSQNKSQDIDALREEMMKMVRDAKRIQTEFTDLRKYARLLDQGWRKIWRTKISGTWRDANFG